MEETWCFIFRKKGASNSTEQRESHLSHWHNNIQSCCKKDTLAAIVIPCCTCSCAKAHTYRVTDLESRYSYEPMFTLLMSVGFVSLPCFLFRLYNILNPDRLRLHWLPLAVAHKQTDLLRSKQLLVTVDCLYVDVSVTTTYLSTYHFVGNPPEKNNGSLVKEGVLKAEAWWRLCLCQLK